jgi:hypothetical protein
MAKYTVKFSCEHVAEVNLYGLEVERQRKIRHMRECWLCPACYEQSKLDEIASLEIALNLPALTGSEKQVKWSRSLRAEYLNDFFRWFKEGIASNKKRGLDVSRDLQMMEKFKGWLRTKNTAKFWIDLQSKLNRTQTIINIFVQET